MSDTTQQYDQNENTPQQKHVGQEGITNFLKVDGLRRSRRKQLEPKWKKDYMNIKGGEQEKRRQKVSLFLPSD